MKFFDFIFYRVYRAYNKTMDLSPEITAFCLVSLVQFLNFLFLMEIFSLLSGLRMISSKPILLTLMILILIINYFRYIKNKEAYQKLDKKWNLQETIIQKRMRVWIIIYIWSTLIITIALTIYIGSANK